jgi:nitrate reductase gamma subunit
MNLINTLAFVVFPYISLTVFVLGHSYRYMTDLFSWNARASQFLEKNDTYAGITIFHWGILLTLVGHVGGLLIPQALYDAVGIDGRTHTLIAYWSGLVIGIAAFVGSVMLLVRRITRERIKLTTTTNDFITLGGLIFVIGVGLYNVIFDHFYVLDTIAPWIRSIVTFTPAPHLMMDVPFSYKIHILGAFILLAYSPFSRLVHIWSAPFVYFLRPWIVMRRKVEHF